MLREFTCIMCPMGCSLEAEAEDTKVLEVRGNRCPRGKEYVLQEITNPVRNIASSILVRDGELPLASVRLSAPIPKKDIFPVMDEIRRIQVNAPTVIGQVVLSNVLGTGANVIVTKNVKRRADT